MENQSVEIDAFEVQEVKSVTMVNDQQVCAIETVTPDEMSVTVLLSSHQAARLSELLLLNGPPVLDGEVKFVIPDHLEGEHKSLGVQVESHSHTTPDDHLHERPYAVSFNLSGRPAFKILLTHRQVVKWHRRLGAEIADFVKRHAN